MAVPYTFGTATASIPLSQLDSNFATVITLGNTAIQLGNTVTTLNNMTLANVTISSGNVTITNVAITTANVTTANITTAVIGTETVTTSTITTANVTTANITTDNITNGTVITSLTLSYGTANGVAYLNGSKVLTTGSALTFDGTNFSVGGTADIFGRFYTRSVGFTSSGSTVLQINGSSYGGIDIGAAGTRTFGITASATDVNFTSITNIPLLFGVNGSEQMRLTSTGLGIGTSSPAAGIDSNKAGVAYAGNVYLTGKFTDGTAALKGIGLGYDNTSQTGIVYAYTGSAASNLAFYTYPGSGSIQERARIDSSGNLLVGATSGTYHNLRKNLAGDYSTVIENTSSTAGTNCLRLAIGTNGDATGTFIKAGDAGAFKFQVLNNGNVQNTNNSYGAISDAKLKENIIDTTPKLVDLMQVKVRNYNLIGDTTKQIGVVAQELETVFPSMIDETPDRDEEGNDIGTTTKSVKYSVFVPMLIKAMQEQQELIESLKARLDAANL